MKKEDIKYFVLFFTKQASKEDKQNLKDKNTIWTQNAKSEYWKEKAKFDGDVGRIYGVQWRDFRGVDQIKNLIDSLKNQL